MPVPVAVMPATLGETGDRTPVNQRRAASPVDIAPACARSIKVVADSAPRGDESGPARPGILMGRPFGIPIYVSPTWFVVAIVITVMFEPQVAQHVSRPI